MELVPVHNVDTVRRFLEVPAFINKNNDDWIRPLDKDIKEVFDSEKNKLFKRKDNECKQWVLEDQGKDIGRVAAFVNKKYRNPGDDQPTGGIGFFDCIDNQKAADFILDHCKKWLRERGMEAMDGPINFGERDRWWGLLVDGFHEPLYGMNYNPPYYQKLFENYGFKSFFHQYCYALYVNAELQSKLYDRHAKFAKDPNYRCEHIDKKKLEKYATDFCTVYNKAWAGHGGNKTMGIRQAKMLFKSMKPVIDERIVWFIYHKEEPIGFWLNLPDLNQWFKYLNGKFGLWQKLHFLWLKKTKKNKRFVGIVFGVVPEFQKTGADAFLMIEGAKALRKGNLYDEFEMEWIGDFNPTMINLAKSIGTHRSRKLTTYRYLFDRNKEFKRHPTIG
ncbi:MAG TPA: hypothetical protein VK084_01685 [Chitinophagaceae bacterium]|nr:hypothetical protein [Chitinophagaceae bacterium]